MIKKIYKLPVQEFIKRRPQTFKRSDFFTIKKMANNLTYSRFGVVISKKVDKRASARNKIKRDIFRYIQINGLYRSGGQDFLIIVNPNKGINRESIEKSFSDIFQNF